MKYNRFSLNSASVLYKYLSLLKAGRSTKSLANFKMHKCFSTQFGVYIINFLFHDLEVKKSAPYTIPTHTTLPLTIIMSTFTFKNSFRKRSLKMLTFCALLPLNILYCKNCKARPILVPPLGYRIPSMARKICCLVL